MSITCSFDVPGILSTFIAFCCVVPGISSIAVVYEDNEVGVLRKSVDGGYLNLDEISTVCAGGESTDNEEVGVDCQ